MTNAATFPQGLRLLLVTSQGCDSEAALRHPDLGYAVTSVHSLQAGQACFAGGAATYDCVLLDQLLLAAGGKAQGEALFRAAAVGQAPVVLVGESPSHEEVMEGVRLGAADYLERPLPFLKLKTLWQHKIRRMMVHANGGALPRPPSCPQLPGSSDGAAAAASGSAGRPVPRSTSVPGLSCPATPSLHPAAAAAPQTSNSLASGSSQGPSRAPAAAGGAAERSDATSGAPRPPPPPLACLRLGATAWEAPASEVDWPPLPGDAAWGTPVGCGIPPPLPGAACAAPATPPAQRLAITWCPPGSLPWPASTYDLLLPEDFSLAGAPPTPATPTGACRGPLGLRLTVTPDLLSGINAALRAGPTPSPAPSPALYPTA
ncbi:expressed protein [Chlorella variabilis]|uniref:Expressed protein n=1 Tax=Chlorella variabilis TaxID=554065 RepID=E1Z8D5_CHLVA|nr:expressed protein [Chlorella variabilis]EFN58327.1 expressed protein [Chlorella variabilis]|eukprot:XP_005850429.1 expressed protein [Chlorella variabilis]